MITREICLQTMEAATRDPAMLGVAKHLFESTGLAERLGYRIDEAKLDPFRPCPADWTAMQIAWFFNGPRDGVRKRPKIQRTKMTWGGNIKIWCRENIQFGNPRHVAWTANFHLWSGAEARQVTRDLLEEGYLDRETVALVDEWVGENEGAEFADRIRYSIPMLKAGLASRWMKGHLVVTIMEDEQPTRAVLVTPDGGVTTNERLSDVMPDGAAFHGNARWQARLARDPRYGQWATEIVS